MRRGGIESFMMNNFRNIDSRKVHIDFAVRDGEDGAYDSEILNSGSQIITLPLRSRHPVRYVRILAKALKDGKYEVVHSQMDAMNGLVLFVAKLCRVPIRISHSHNTSALTRNPIKRVAQSISKTLINISATDLMACSHAAGEWLYGKSCNFQVIPNAIDTSRFTFNNALRTRTRIHENLEDSTVIGCIGRFDYQKNQEFLIHVMNGLRDNPRNFKLVLVGDGKDKSTVQAMVEQFDLQDVVLFVKSTSKVENWYNAFDIFVMPSRFEGLSVAAIEAQTNGLKCLFSDRVSDEVRITKQVSFLPIDDPANWVSRLETCDTRRLQDAERIVGAAGYSIEQEASMLERYYLSRAKF